MKQFLKEVPQYCKLLTLQNANSDAPWTITIDVRKPKLKERLLNALATDFDCEKVKITGIGFSSISMLGELSFTAVQDGEEIEETLWMSSTTIY